MGCGCREQASKQGRYENVVKIAKSYAVAENVTVAIYRRQDGTFGFIPIDCPEYRQITPFQHISPL